MILKRAILVLSTIVIFLLGSGFNTQAPIEYREDGVLIRDMSQVTELNLSDDDYDLLMRIAIAEAGNQDTKGQALVMCVVLNRWQSGRYGETLREVIYAPSQFYTAGMYRHDIHTVWQGELSQGRRKQILTAKAAATWIQFGWDESDGALYFCADGWNYYGKEHLFKYGDHWFSK